MNKIEFSKFINFIFIVYLICLLRLAVFRDSFSIFHIFEVGEYNLSFFSDLAEIYKNDKKIFLILFLGNLGWFFPFGAYLRYKNISILKILFFSFLFSLLVESSQFIFKCGIFEIDDFILNTIGAVLGAIFINIILNFKKEKNDKKNKRFL